MTNEMNAKPVVPLLKSLATLPMWVKVWLVALGLTNVASLAFLNQPSGVVVAILAFSGIILSKIAVSYAGGLTRLVSVGHIVGWVPLVLMLLFARPLADGAYDTYLAILLIMNTISILFDLNDFRLWLSGDRDVII